jgi:uncharacterized protein YjiS (DUF1127 family)
MNAIGKLVRFIQQRREMSTLRETRAYLLTLDDRLLEDAGFSRDLLMKGVKAWPWRPDEQLQDQELPHAVSQRELEAAASTLRGFSDKDLRDLGIGRGEIGYVVQHGRQGYDRDRNLSAA